MATRGVLVSAGAARVARAAVLALTFLGATAHPGAAAPPATTDLVSLNGTGNGPLQGNSHSFSRDLTADGRFALFASAATNLAPHDTNGFTDLFVRDRHAETTERINVSSHGIQANDVTEGIVGTAFIAGSAISDGGRFVAFASAASNLVPGDTNFSVDVFVRDRQAGKTARVSVSETGVQVNGLSAYPAMSANGRFVAFGSDATNLVPGDTNGVQDVFVRDLKAGTLTRVSVRGDETQANGPSADFTQSIAISDDGLVVAFASSATNLVAGDTNGARDIFVRDLRAGTTARVSVNSAEQQSAAEGGTVPNSHNPSVSADGQIVAFSSDASNLVAGDTNGVRDIFVRDRQAGTTRRVSVSGTGTQANAGSNSGSTSVSPDGGFVAFSSSASNLVAGDTNAVDDAFLHDLLAGRTERISVSSLGNQGTANSGGGHVGADGRFVLFSSEASELVAGDTNAFSDAFVRAKP